MSLLELALLIIDFRNRGCELQADPTDERAFIISAPHKLTPVERQIIDAHASQVLVIVRNGLDRGIEVLARLRRCRSYAVPGLGNFTVIAALATLLRGLQTDDFTEMIATLRALEDALISNGAIVDLQFSSINPEAN